MRLSYVLLKKQKCVELFLSHEKIDARLTPYRSYALDEANLWSQPQKKV